MGLDPSSPFVERILKIPKKKTIIVSYFPPCIIMHWRGGGAFLEARLPSGAFPAIPSGRAAGWSGGRSVGTSGGRAVRRSVGRLVGGLRRSGGQAHGRSVGRSVSRTGCREVNRTVGRSGVQADGRSDRRP